MVRMIAGKFRSRRLKTLPGARTRPTSDRLRETLFNVLSARVEGAVFCDVYAGSGAVGIEALSRGAARVYFLENHRAAVQVIQANLKSLGVKGAETEILSLDAGQALKTLATRGITLDIVFVDPPYQASEEYARTLGWLGTGSLLSPAAVVVAEHDKRHPLADTYQALERTRTLQQGDSVLSFYRWSADK